MAKGRGARLYVAGGVVRDLLLGRPIWDADVVVDADALDFARVLAPRVGASTTFHRRFGTATLFLPGGERLDVAGTRRETYAHPGALPAVVAGASIEEDLERRDFTVNAMALEVSPRRRLLDPAGGRKDLSRGVIRALHARSFLDDPTRAYRAVRYANRLGFRIERETAKAIAAAVGAGAFDRVSGDRLRRELRGIFEEPRRAAALRRLEALGLDAAVDPALARGSRAVTRLRLAESIASRLPGQTTWLCYLLAWLSDADEGEIRRVADRLGFAARERQTVRGWPGVRLRLEPGLAAWAPSELGVQTRSLSADEIVAAATGLPPVDRRALLERVGRSARVRLTIGGADLRAHGVPAGPAIGKALASTLAAREDRRIAAEEELAFALRAAREAAG